ncbi:MAG: prepilin-type N-terminal cleavage/methylation domain-containing protein [Lentisphaerae bacterium]|nr:prepilin-type N-terminal cleavage/methylation domain-containing protein [Lentisphaerota bacterium]
MNHGQQSEKKTGYANGMSNGFRFAFDALRSPLSALRAFTLIEVLVAMAVLAVLLLMAANVFQGSSTAWLIGTQKADMNTSARAALDFMARELASAVAGPIEKAIGGGAQYLQFRVEDLDDIRFLALSNDPDASGNERAVRGVFFWHDDTVDKNTLKYDREVSTPATLDCYAVASPAWHDGRSSSSVLITNVLALNFYVYTSETGLLATNFISPPQTLTELPFCVDISIETISDDDMRKYNKLSGADQANFRARNAKLYTTRVYSLNRVGYQAR